jgi:hypothetical protein
MFFITCPRGHNLNRTDARVILVNSWKRILLEDDIHIEKGIKPKHNIRVTCIESGAVSTELLETITDESME